MSSKVTGLASAVLGDQILPAILDDLDDSVSFETVPTDTLALLRLYGDNQAALLIVLQAAHLHTPLIPSKVSIDLFHKIAVVCHKFDMAQILLPWPSIWTFGLPRKTHVAEWLEIAWVFCQVKLFNQVTRKLVIHSKFDGNWLALL